MSAPTIPQSPQTVAKSIDRGADRYEAVRQYSLRQILGVWAAAAVPMGVLAWVVAPWLRDQLGGDEPLAQALLILLTLGLIWQFVLVLILEVGAGGTSVVARARGSVAAAAPGSEDRPGGRKGLVVGASLRRPVRHLGVRADDPRAFGEGFRRLHWHRPRRGLLPRRVG